MTAQHPDPAVLQSMVDASLDGIIIIEERWIVTYANPAACRIVGRPLADLIHHSFLEFIAEHYRDQQVAQSLSNRPDLYDTVIVRPDGTERIVTYSTELLPANGADSSFAVLRDVTEARRAEAEARDLALRLERRNAELATLLEVSRDVALTLELKPLLGQLLNKLKSLVDYSGAAVFTLQSEEALELLCYQGPLPQDSLVWHWDLQLARHNRAVVEERRPVILPDVRADTPLAAAFRATAEAQLGYVPAVIGTWLGVPLLVRDQVIGVLAFDHHATQAYTEEQVELAQVFAQQAAAAIENARLFEQSQDKAALEERARLARELHDSVSQALYGITLGARAALNAAKHNPPGLQAPLEYIASLAEAGIAEMRALIFELRPESLAEEGLVAALARQAAAVTARYETEVSTQLGDEPELPLTVKEAVYRIAQEALHNAVKHAEARRITLRLAHLGGELTLEVCDDGKGFDTTADFPGHLGQRTMRERAAALGGHLTVASGLGAGTQIRLEVTQNLGLSSS